MEFTSAGLSVPFIRDKHIEFIRKVSNDESSLEFLVSQHLRMSGVYWGLTAYALLGEDVRTLKADESSKQLTDCTSLNKSSDTTPSENSDNISTKSGNRDEMIEWIMGCYDPETGGFGGNTCHDAHMLYTLSALQILALYESLSIIQRDKVISFVVSLQQPDGSFAGDKWGEIDTRFSYCALSILSILGALDSEETAMQGFSKSRAVDFIVRCKNFDGGFGAVPGAESHAGQIFCCVGALSIAGGLEHVDVDLLGWWLSERQCDSGGLNGRPEKQADVCYSWWILSTLSILGRTSWIDCSRLTSFILQCQDQDDGGISDRPGNMPDIFHTFFGICGLLLLKYFETNPSNYSTIMKDVDPTYALPKEVVRQLGLYSQTLPDTQSLIK